jgi:hypothetical protein
MQQVCKALLTFKHLRSGKITRTTAARKLKAYCVKKNLACPFLFYHQIINTLGRAKNSTYVCVYYTPGD